MNPSPDRSEAAQAADPADRSLSEFIGYGLKRAMSVVQADLGPVLARHGLRAVSFSALSVIVDVPGLTQSALADVLQVERSNLVILIDELAGRDLIQRAFVAHDRRRHALMPTAAGRKLAAEARASVAAHEALLFAALSPDEQAELRRLLQKFRRSAEA